MTESTPEKRAESEHFLTIELKDGAVEIELFPEDAPEHVRRIRELAEAGLYDGVAFHRVIDGFMAQTGDVKFGNADDYDEKKVGLGGSDKPDLKAEFNDRKHERGTCSMARASSPDSANSQFFICLEDAGFLNGQYTVWGRVVEGMEHVDQVKKGSESNNGSVNDPDFMRKVSVGKG